MTISFRMTAVIANVLHVPVDISWSYFAFMSGLKRASDNSWHCRRADPWMVSFNAHLPAIFAQRPQPRFKKIASYHQLANLGAQLVDLSFIGCASITAALRKP
jgi:hypothetical protein